MEFPPWIGEVIYSAFSQGLSIVIGPESTNTRIVALVCLLEWGMMRTVGGAMVIMHDAPFIAGNSRYKSMTVRILKQHGLNMLFVGSWCTTLAVCCAICGMHRYTWYFSVWPWSFDVSYFIALDLHGCGSPPGQYQMHVITAGLMATSVLVKREFSEEVGRIEEIMTFVVPFLAMIVVTMNKLLSPKFKGKVIIAQLCGHVELFALLSRRPVMN